MNYFSQKEIFFLKIISFMSQKCMWLMKVIFCRSCNCIVFNIFSDLVQIVHISFVQFFQKMLSVVRIVRICEIQYLKNCYNFCLFSHTILLCVNKWNLCPSGKISFLFSARYSFSANFKVSWRCCRFCFGLRGPLINIYGLKASLNPKKSLYDLLETLKIVKKLYLILVQKTRTIYVQN